MNNVSFYSFSQVDQAFPEYRQNQNSFSQIRLRICTFRFSKSQKTVPQLSQTLGFHFLVLPGFLNYDKSLGFKSTFHISLVSIIFLLPFSDKTKFSAHKILSHTRILHISVHIIPLCSMKLLSKPITTRKSLKATELNPDRFKGGLSSGRRAGVTSMLWNCNKVAITWCFKAAKVCFCDSRQWSQRCGKKGSWYRFWYGFGHLQNLSAERCLGSSYPSMSKKKNKQSQYDSSLNLHVVCSAFTLKRLTGFG